MDGVDERVRGSVTALICAGLVVVIVFSLGCAYPLIPDWKCPNCHSRNVVESRDAHAGKLYFCIHCHREWRGE
jgi:hypothetical protein